MNTRLEQFLKAENISQSQFADTIGVARANVSHIISGRNKPGFDFLLRMSKHYPSLNLEWLITGKGKMFSSAKATLFEPEDFPLVPETAPKAVQKPEPRELKIQQQKPIVQQISDSRNISKIIVFYDDGSYIELK